MNAFVIDTFEFSRHKEHREGELAVADLSRLCEETADKSGAIHWAIQGGANAHGHPQVVLKVSGAVKLMCQRCLTPFDFAVESESVLVLAKDEAAADEIDALLADDSVDVIVGARALDMRELIEDEVLLTIPLSPKHEACPDQPGSGFAADTDADAKRISPFAVLKSKQ